MLLAIDVGNTDTVFALFDGESQQTQWRTPTDSSYNAEDYLFLLPDEHGITDIIIASVVPEALPGLKTFSDTLLGKPAYIIGENISITMPVLLERPEEVGADRIVDAIEGYHSYGGPLLIVDFGTATTIEAVSTEGEYLGGAIAPGIRLSIEALKNGTAKLPEVTLAPPPDVIGKTTEHAIQSGIYWGYVELISGLIRRHKESLHAPDCNVIATGGLAHLFAKEIPAIRHVDDALTMRGLMRVFRQALEIK